MSDETNLLALPEELLGKLYSLLDPPSRRAFFSSAKDIRWAPSVLRKVCHLTICLQDKRLFSEQSPLLSFPSGCTMTALTVQGLYHTFTVEGPDAGEYDDLDMLVKMLQPEDKKLRSPCSAVLQRVESFTLQSVMLETTRSPERAQLLSKSLALLPSMRVLKLSGMEGDFRGLVGAKLFDIITAQLGSQLHELWVTDGCVPANLLHHVCQLSHLRVLFLDGVASESLRSVDTQIPFAAMSQLECLAIHGNFVNGPKIMDHGKRVARKVMLDIGAALSHLSRLKKLVLPCAPPAGVFLALRMSLEELEISQVEQQDGPDLPALLAAIARKQLPAKLRSFRIHSLHVREGLKDVDPCELAPRMRLVQDGGPHVVDYKLRDLAADLQACASVCADVGIEGIHAITHISDTQVLSMLEIMGLDISRALRSVSLAAGSQLLPQFRDCAPNISDITFLCWKPELFAEALTAMPRLERVCQHVFITDREDFQPEFKEGFVGLCAHASRIRSGQHGQPHLTIHLDVMDIDDEDDPYYEEETELHEDDLRESLNKFLNEARGPRGLRSCPGQDLPNVSVTSELIFFTVQNM